MTRWPFVSRRECLRREASNWIARLNGTPDRGEREAFERWYHADADHAATYDRLSEVFAATAHIRPKSSAGTIAPAPDRGVQGVRTRYAMAALAAVGAVAILGYAVLGARETAPTAQGGVQVALFVATASESRLVSLVDGSEVLLSPGSELDVDIDRETRKLRLRRGEGRFTVSPEARPFVVAASGSEIAARGTQFVVRLLPEGLLVSLIEGRVDVTYPSSPAGVPGRVASLEAGQRLIVRAVAEPTGTSEPAQRSAAPMVEFDDTRLAEAVEFVNRKADGQVRLSDPALADLRVTGAFRAGDAEGFAQGIAAALDLSIERESDGTIWLGASNGI